MALNVGELVAYLRLDSSQFQSGLATAPAEAGKAGAAMGNTMGNGILNTVKTFAAPIAATFGAMAIADFFKDAVNGASDFVEQGAAVGQVFGKGAEAIKKEAENAATGLGQSKTQFLEAAKTFGVYGNAAGLAGEDNAKFSTDLVKLATDLASFNNTPVDEAIQALGAGLRGESEPLKRFGILMNEDALQAAALKAGIVEMNVDVVKLEKAQINAEKAQAKYNEAVKKFGPDSMEAKEAQNKLAESNIALGIASKGKVDKLTAEQKVLAANYLIMEQTKTQQGDFGRTSEGLANQQRILDANMANLAITVGTFLLPAINAVVSAMNPFVTFIADYAAPIGAFAIAIGLLTLAYNAQAIATALVNSAVWANTAALLANPVTWIIIGIAALVAIIVLLATHWDEVTKFITEAWANAMTWFGEAFTNLGKWWSDLWTGIGTFFADTWNGLVSWIHEAVGVWVRWWNGVWEGVGTFFADLWDGLVDGIGDFWNDIVKFFTNLPSNIVGFFSGVGEWLFDAGANLIEGLFDGIKSLAGNIGKFFLDLLPSWIVEPFKLALGIHSPSKVFEKFGTNTMEGYLQGVVKMKGSVANTLKGAVSTPSVSNAVSSMSASQGNGGGGTINYYAAENQSLSAEEALFAALSSPRVRVA